MAFSTVAYFVALFTYLMIGFSQDNLYSFSASLEQDIWYYKYSKNVDVKTLFGEDRVTTDETIKPFLEYHNKVEIEAVPFSFGRRNKIIYIDIPMAYNLTEDDIKALKKRKIGWIYTEENEILPVVNEKDGRRYLNYM